MENGELSTRLVIVISIVIFSKCMANHCQANVSQNSNCPQKQSQKIETYILEKHQGIENIYNRQIEALELSVENKAKKLGASYINLWLEFHMMIEGRLAANSYFLRPDIRHETKSDVFRLREDMIKSYAITSAKFFLLDPEARKLIFYIRTSNNYSDRIRKQTRKVLVVMDQSQSTLKHIQEQRQYNLEKLACLKNDLKQKALALEQYTKDRSENHKQGIVNMIAYDSENYMAIIDDKLVRQGDYVDGARILGIQAEEVEFEKNGKSWVQKLYDQ